MTGNTKGFGIFKMNFQDLSKFSSPVPQETRVEELRQQVLNKMRHPHLEDIIFLNLLSVIYVYTCKMICYMAGNTKGFWVF